jgi:hypothetical protein
VYLTVAGALATSLPIAARRMTRHPPGNWRARPTRGIITDPPSKCFIKFDDLLGLVSGRIVRCGALRHSAAMRFRRLDHRTATFADGVEPAGGISTLLGLDDGLSRHAAHHSVPRRNSAIIAGYGPACVSSVAYSAGTTLDIVISVPRHRHRTTAKHRGVT